jgi:hypothetical protein
LFPRFVRASLIAVAVAVATQACAPPSAGQAADAAVPQLSLGYGTVPMSFAANQGQSDDAVKFLARGQGYSLFLTETEAVLALAAPSSQAADAAIVRMRLIGANQHPQIAGVEPLPGRSNYFIGNDPARWQRDVPNYARVKYTGVYPGIDQVYYGNQRQVEYDLIVAAGGDPQLITLAFDGVEQLSLDRQGNLVLRTSHGEMTQHKPVIYQEIGGRRQPVDGHYVLQADDRVGFAIASYDTTQTLVIDPVLSYSTYFGGNSNDVGQAIAVDSQGSAYITGETLSTNFPGASTSPIRSTKSASYDAFVSKLDAAGTSIVYSTYLGGSGGDYGYDIAVDSAGNAYVTGQTDSPTTSGSGNVPFPVVGGVQAVYRGGGDAFVTKINASGNALIYSTYLGGSGVERGYGIAVDHADNAYVTGYTNSVNGPGNFPTSAPFQSQNGGSYDAFVSKLNVSGNGLVYSTYLGGTASEHSIYGGAIAVDSNGNAYVGGSTSSLNFPGASASTIQSSNGGGFTDGFVVKFDGAGGGLLYSTYLGGNGYDEINGLAVDAAGDAYVAGYTDSTNFPVVAALQPSKNGSGNDAFVSRLNGAGNALAYSTYLGGSGNDIAYDVTVDGQSNAYLSGTTSSTNFPVLQAFQTVHRGSGDAFISALTPAGSALLYSSYLGGSTGAEHATGVAVNSAGEAYLTGNTNSSNFPTATPLQSTIGGAGTDAFVVKITAATPAALGPPRNLVATAIIGNTVSIAWQAPLTGTATGYVLEGGVAPGDVLATIPTSSAATNFTFVAPTGSFYIRMRAVAGGLTSSASNEIRIDVNTGTIPPVPSAPANLQGSANGNNLSLSWTNTTAGGAATGLILDVTGSLNLSLGLPLGDTFSFAGVTPGTYTMSLRAVNGAGSSGSSNSITLTFPGQCAAPGTPTNFAVTTSGNVVTASWSLPASGPAPTSYTVMVTGAFNGTFATPSLSLAGAVAPGTYTVMVAATNACGTGAPSSAQTVTVQ